MWPASLSAAMDYLTARWLAGNQGMEENMDTTVMDDMNYSLNS